MTAVSTPSAIRRWDGRFGTCRRNHAPPRPFAALSYLVRGPILDGLVEVEDLTFVAIYDELQSADRLALHVAGYAGRPTPWGVQWGGAEQNWFFKDLFLRPMPGARGRRLDSASADLIALGMQLNRQIERHCRCPWIVGRTRLSLPHLWAGFRGFEASKINGDGSELTALAQKVRRPPGELLARHERLHAGLSLFPLEWVRQHWQGMTAVFAELAQFPRWQVFAVRNPAEDLQGQRGAAKFDFYRSRFRKSDPPLGTPPDVLDSAPIGL